MQTKVISETTAIKTEQQGFSLPQKHFIEYLAGDRETTMKIRQEITKTQALKPVAQVQDWLPPARIHTQMKSQQSFYYLTSISSNT
jgi:hypothetical protein